MVDEVFVFEKVNQFHFEFYQNLIFNNYSNIIPLVIV